MKTVITVCYLTGWEHDTVTEGYGFSLGVLRNIPVKRPLSCQNKKQQQRVLIKNHYIKPEKGGNYCIFFPAWRSNHSDSFLVDLNTILLLSLSPTDIWRKAVPLTCLGSVIFSSLFFSASCSFSEASSSAPGLGSLAWNRNQRDSNYIFIFPRWITTQPLEPTLKEKAFKSASTCWCHGIHRVCHHNSRLGSWFYSKLNRLNQIFVQLTVRR